MIGMITGDNYVVIEKALSAINKSQLDSYRVQQLLLKALVKENYNVQILVINKIEDCNLLKQANFLKNKDIKNPKINSLLKKYEN